MRTFYPPLRRLLAATTILVLSSCKEDDQQLNRLQSEIQALGDKQSQAQSELNRMKMQLNSLGKERDVLKEEKTRLEAELQNSRKTMDQMQKDFATYRSQYKLSMRAKAPGMTLGSLVVDGKTFLNAKIRECTEEALTIMHDAGAQKISWNNMPDSIRKLFGYENPGEYVVKKFLPDIANDKPLTTVEKIDLHDTAMVDLQQQINALDKELAALKKSMTENRRDISQAKAKNLDMIPLERAHNAYLVRQTQIDAELAQLKKKQTDLMRDDPRRKRF